MTDDCFEHKQPRTSLSDIVPDDSVNVSIKSDLQKRKNALSCRS